MNDELIYLTFFKLYSFWLSPFCHCTETKAYPVVKTQRDGGEREGGGGIGMGNTCKSMADSCQCMTKTTTIF